MVFNLTEYVFVWVAGILTGAFLPSVGRSIKALWVKETSKLKTAAVADATKVEQDLKSKL